MTQALPARPNLAYLRKLAKERLKKLRASEPDAKLARAQLAVARDHGFASWRKLKDHVDAAIAAALARQAEAYEDPFITSLPAHRRGHKVVQWKPLMDAAYTGDVERARHLLDAGADPNVISSTPHRYRPLHRAIEHKKTQPRGPQHERVVRLLLQRGADPKLRATFSNLTALALSATGDTRFVPILLPRFQPLDIFHAAAIGDDTRVAALLRKDPSLAKAVDVNGWTALHYCCASATFKSSPVASDALVRIATMLLDGGADAMAPFMFEGIWPIRPLYHCCGQHDNPALTELLLRHGATPCDDESVYHAADEGHRRCLDLIEKYTDAKRLAEECSKCLASQLHWGHTRGAEWLLRHGADPNYTSERYGESALHGAVRHGSSDKIIRMLLSHGANPKLKNKLGQSAIALAKSLKRTRILEHFKISA
jgi:ankyrin repeat protein